MVREAFSPINTNRVSHRSLHPRLTGNVRSLSCETSSEGTTCKKKKKKRTNAESPFGHSWHRILVLYRLACWLSQFTTILLSVTRRFVTCVWSAVGNVLQICGISELKSFQVRQEKWTWIIPSLFWSVAFPLFISRLWGSKLCLFSLCHKHSFLRTRGPTHRVNADTHTLYKYTDVSWYSMRIDAGWCNSLIWKLTLLNAVCQELLYFSPLDKPIRSCNFIMTATNSPQSRTNAIYHHMHYRALCWHTHCGTSKDDHTSIIVCVPSFSKATCG